MPHVIRPVVSGSLLAAVFVACTLGTGAQQAPPAIDAATRQQVIDGAQSQW